MRDVRFDVVGFESDVLEAFALLLEKAENTGLRVLVLNQVQPALVAEKDARVELHAQALIIPEITGFQAERPLEMCARSLQVTHDDADVLNAENRHV